jgi:hypothetical protein
LGYRYYSFFLWFDFDVRHDTCYGLILLEAMRHLAIIPCKWYITTMSDTPALARRQGKPMPVFHWKNAGPRWARRFILSVAGNTPLRGASWEKSVLYEEHGVIFELTL